ncbi:MAG: enoyl-CoA hydratase/isomerase family protein [Burkholderiales bacterium]|nr:enoyl-CoA hydratase/isomerase family protein [Burkholderiales bacterium]
MFRFSVGGDGVATLTFDDSGRSMNVLNEASLASLYRGIEAAVADPQVKAVLIESGKDDFIAGADLDMVLAFDDREKTFQDTLALHRHLRRLETCGKPVAVAINGTALGGGFELCLACHRRIAGDRPKARIGLPEVTLGLLPGGGGTQRLPRLLGIRAALPLLLEGKTVAPAAALELGLVHEVVPAGSESEAARAWLLANIGKDILQPWDAKGYRIPGGPVQSPQGMETFFAGNPMTLAKTRDNYPAPRWILSCVYEGLQTDFDTGCRTEAAYFVEAAFSPEARAMIRTVFIGMGRVKRQSARPTGIAPRRFSRVGVLGAGMMGAGIAFAQASAGIDTVLLDVTTEAAERGKRHAQDLLDRRMAKGRTTQEAAAAVLARILPTTDYDALAGCDLVIEAVFEDRAIKAEVTRAAEARLARDAIVASNTSTLPITGLARACARPERFIGLHFFSPVDRMELVEVIVGEATSDETLAHAMDYVKQIRKIAIVVRDSRGFYTSRVCASYVREGLRMLTEGIAPALIDNAGTLAGMPVGPLALADELALDTILRINRQNAADLGAEYERSPVDDVVETMVERCHRLGKARGGGFYDYEPGRHRRIWPGLAERFPRRDPQPALDVLQRRLLHVQAIDAARCLEAGVVRSATDADVGALLGWGFPVCRGGPIGLIRQLGAATFCAECDGLAAAYGPRFTPTERLRRIARGDEPFYAD